MKDQTQDKRAVARKFKSRKWPWVLLGILVILLLALMLTPVYLSSDSFKRMIQAQVGRSTGGELNIGDLSVGWLKGVQVADLSFREQTGWASVNIGAISTQPHLGALLGRTVALGRIVVDRPHVEIDLRKRPPAAEQPDRGPVQPTSWAFVADTTINNGRVSLTGQQGRTVRIENIDSTLNVRPPGQTSSLQADMVVADANQNARIHAAGSVTPTAWTLKGTSGDIVIEVNDLNLDSLAPIFELAGVDLQTQGRLTADIQGDMQDGQVQSVTANVRGQDLNISGAALKGDRLQTSQLNVNARLIQQDQTIRIEQLDARADWATLAASGTVPTTAASLSDLLQADADYRLQGQFDCNLPALLSQIPNTLGLKPGMQINAGALTGSVSTTTASGRARIVADTKIVGLAGEVDGQALSLSEPVTARLELSADDQTARLDTLDVRAAFANVTAGGNFEQITYSGAVDLARFQSELGQFANLGPYEMAGNLTSDGQVSIREEEIAAAGTAAIQQLVLTSADGNSVSEPAANVEFALGLNQAQNILEIDRINAQSSFGNIAVESATVPLGEAPAAAMKADVIVRDLDLARAKPFAVFFASFPAEVGLAGIVQSQLAITGQDSTYRIGTTDTQIQGFELSTPEAKPFAQEQVTLSGDVQLDTADKSINIENLLLESPQLRITKGEFKKTAKGDENQIQGSLEGEADWAAIGQVASVFLPEGLEMAGQRRISMNFASTYPAHDPNLLMPNLNAAASTGFDSASYMGLNVGPTDLDIRIENGLMHIEPFSTTVNNGRLDFAAQADFRAETPLLRTPEPMMLVQGVQINREMTSKLLQYVNPLFANIAGVSGIANFECQTLAIPLSAGMEDQIEVVGTISATDILLEASGLLSQLLTAMNVRTGGDMLTIQPTNFALQNGVLRYDQMQVNIGENPITFSGEIGLDERLNMTVTLPWTTEGRKVRVGEEQPGRRIEVPLRGTLSRPELDLRRLLQDQIFRGLEGLFNR